MNNDTVKVILGDRRTGLTSTLHSEINSQIVKGQRRNLIVFATADRIHGFVRTRQGDFPFVPVPDYTLINNLLKIRGMQYQCIYIEDIQDYDDGIYDSRLGNLFLSLYNNDEAEVVFTASRLELNQRSRVVSVTPQEVLQRAKRRWRKK